MGDQFLDIYFMPLFDGNIRLGTVYKITVIYTGLNNGLHLIYYKFDKTNIWLGF